MDGQRIVVVGGGIGGLSAALALNRFGHRPVLVEQAVELRPVGAGISLWPNGIKILGLLGVGPGVRALGGAMERMAYADTEGKTLVDFPLEELYRRVGQRALPVARSELQSLLLDAVTAQLGSDAVRLGTRATAVVEHDAGVTVTTAAGDELTADAVIGADGTHSWLRDYVAGRPIPRRYVGYVNWNGLVASSDDIAPIGTWLTWVGDHKRVSVMPVGGGRCYWFFDVPMPLEEAERLPADHRATLRHFFAGWPAGVSELIERMDPAAVARIPLHDVDPLDRWSRGRVTLLGDSAHCMPPDLGQGGCQALEDAWVLALYLSSTDRGVADAFVRYETERMPRTAEILRRARKRSDITHGVDPAANAAWYASLGTEGHEGILDGLAESVETGPVG